ncbi:MAG: O-sialoglycoprotein endopeptidase [Nitrososphaeraceae archaeon]|nr:O-sialoglycoprotein endopeptidase [Nitrososphaeraceae archaeon]
MKCLGIESTAHTFSCSIVSNEENNKILSEARSIYKPPEGSGIHPRDASRNHMNNAEKILRIVFEQANVSIKDIDIVAYSAGPGLGPCLRVGAVVARAIASFYNKPIVPINHAVGHVELGIMLTGANNPLVLLVSGGHTMILIFSNKRWRIFGETLDITIGQLFDQFGRSIGLSSPCGNMIEKFAKLSDKYIQMPIIIKGNDVSFSGLLTRAKSIVSKNSILKNETKQEKINEVCFSLQETAFAMLTETVERGMSFTGKKEVLIVGGVSANQRLLEMLEKATERQNGRLYKCPYNYAGDNGAQIAWTGIMDYISTKRVITVENTFVRQGWRINTVDINWRN